MLQDYMGRGLELLEELERSISEGSDEALSDSLFNQLVKINAAIASSRAADLSDIAQKAMYLRNVVSADPFPVIGEVEWLLIQSIIDDVTRLASVESGSADQQRQCT